ncbi:MAG: peptide transporter [candidate division Zixibacteria bacterium]|nr:peptide transporter [candidate division Zixibacteria bacterium]
MSNVKSDIATLEPAAQTPEYQDGFNLKTVIGIFFLGVFMIPGSIYLNLIAGQSLGPAAEWTTIILFIEVARRSFTTLRRQEIYMLYYVAASLTAGVGLALSGGPFAQLIWNQYFVQSPGARAFGIDDQIPSWISPPATSEGILERSLFHADWLAPILLVAILHIFNRASAFTLGYGLFRVTADIEHLPFPLAPIQAEGATALAESSSGKETWRWRAFSIGAMLGLVFGAFYIGIPAITGALLTEPITLIPIPFVDLTRNTESILPAAAVALELGLGPILTGFVLPFWIVIGASIGAVLTMIINPVLYHFDVLKTWSPGMDTIQTTLVNDIDFWMSVRIGTGLAVALIGIWSIFMGLRSQMKNRASGQLKRSLQPPPERGDFPLKAIFGVFLLLTVGYVVLSWRLVPGFPVLFFIFYGFVYTPLSSYASARLRAITGTDLQFPLIKEATFILSGYKGVDIWFAPIPIFNYGGQAQAFREIELTGTRFSSVLKAELVMIPVLLACSLLFWHFVWGLAPVPSQAYPYAQKFWQQQATMQALWYASTTGVGFENSYLLEALKTPFILGGTVFGVVAYAVLAVLNLPVMLIFGVIATIGTVPQSFLPNLFGALLGRYYMEKKFGRDMWHRYTPVLAAGYACGTGLVGMATVAIALISKTVSPLVY